MRTIAVAKQPLCCKLVCRGNTLCVKGAFFGSHSKAYGRATLGQTQTPCASWCSTVSEACCLSRAPYGRHGVKGAALRALVPLPRSKGTAPAARAVPIGFYCDRSISRNRPIFSSYRFPHFCFKKQKSHPFGWDLAFGDPWGTDKYFLRKSLMLCSPLAALSHCSPLFTLLCAAAPTTPRCICHRQRFGVVARKALGLKTTHRVVFFTASFYGSIPPFLF